MKNKMAMGCHYDFHNKGSAKCMKLSGTFISRTLRSIGKELKGNSTGKLVFEEKYGIKSITGTVVLKSFNKIPEEPFYCNTLFNGRMSKQKFKSFYSNFDDATIDIINSRDFSFFTDRRVSKDAMSMPTERVRSCKSSPTTGRYVVKSPDDDSGSRRGSVNLMYCRKIIEDFEKMSLASRRESTSTDDETNTSVKENISYRSSPTRYREKSASPTNKSSDSRARSESPKYEISKYETRKTRIRDSFRRFDIKMKWKEFDILLNKTSDMTSRKKRDSFIKAPYELPQSCLYRYVEYT